MTIREYTDEKLIAALAVCHNDGIGCQGCPLAADSDEACGSLERELAKRLTEQMRWIPVQERLPEITETVLTVSDEGVHEGCWLGTGAWRLAIGIRTRDVTHWRPMPRGLEVASYA